MALTPDPPPSSRAPVTYVAYDYRAPAWNPVTGKLIPNVMFACHVTVSGKRFCLRYTRGDT